MKNVAILMFVFLQEPEEGAGAGHHAPLRGDGLLPLQLPGSCGQYSRGENVILLSYFQIFQLSYLKYSDKYYQTADISALIIKIF